MDRRRREQRPTSQSLRDPATHSHSYTRHTVLFSSWIHLVLQEAKTELGIMHACQGKKYVNSE